MSCPLAISVAANNGVAPNRPVFGNRRNGFTLVELLVAMTISLIMVYAMVEIFRTIGASTSDGRAVIDMQGQLKTARALLHQDLRGLTVAGTTWPSADAANGYVYYDEGRMLTKPGGDAFFSNDVVPVYRTFATDPPNSTNPADRLLSSLPLYDDGQFGRGPWDSLSITETDNNNNPHELEVVNFVSRTAPLGEPAFNNAPHVRHAFGDVNDILMFTVRSTTTPFRGRYNGTIVESQVAEIIWWTQLNENPSTLNGVWDLGESFSLRRRVLLVRPDLNVALVNSTTGVLPYNNVIDGSGNPLPQPATLDPMFAKLLFLHGNDISVRVAGTQTNNGGVFGAQPLRMRDTAAAAGSNNYYLAANSLADLAQRHNRSMFDPYPITVAGTQTTISPVMFHMDGDTLELCGFEPNGDMAGEDVVIRKVAGFDVRAFDPYAPVYQYNYDGNIIRVQPGDEAFAKVATDATQNTLYPTLNVAPSGPGDPYPPVGYGAYVDLGWGQTIRHDQAGNPLLGIGSAAAWPLTGKTTLENWIQLFAYGSNPNDSQVCTPYFMRPSAYTLPYLAATRGRVQAQGIIGAPDGTGLVMRYSTSGDFQETNAYDTWSLAYESDGLDENRLNGTDEGRDGLSRDNLSERETSPPYDRQLRGIEVRIRMYDADTRQVRQVTVVGDLSDSH